MTVTLGQWPVPSPFNEASGGRRCVRRWKAGGALICLSISQFTLHYNVLAAAAVCQERWLRPVSHYVTPGPRATHALCHASRPKSSFKIHQVLSISFPSQRRTCANVPLPLTGTCIWGRTSLWPQVLHPWIQPTMGQKYLKKNCICTEHVQTFLLTLSWIIQWRNDLTGLHCILLYK